MHVQVGATASGGRFGALVVGHTVSLTTQGISRVDLVDFVKLGPMLKFGVVALGVTDVLRATKFWSAALGYELREDGFGGWAKVLVPPDGTGTAIALQLSHTPPQDHPRLHFDLHAADANEQEAEAARLVSLGARRVDWDSYPEDPDFIVLEDPEGNRFCIVDLSHEQT
jgi:catechol 2,3-dioxygenase-like lactoylglutathione lyase family enzyme